MAVAGEPESAVLSQHIHVVRALIASVEEAEPPSPYVVQRLAEHVATAGAWDDLAAAPYLLDQLDPDSVAAAALRAAFGRSDLPGSIGASLSARHLFNRLNPQDRLMTRWIAVACGARSWTASSHAWARIRGREPPHVAMFGHRGSVRAILPWSQAGRRTLLITAGDDGAIRVWDPTTGRPASEPLAERGPPVLSMVTMTVDGRLLLSAGGPSGIGLWDLRTGARVTPEGSDDNHPVRVLAALPQPDGTVLLAGADAGGAIRLWRVYSDRLSAEASPAIQHRVQGLAALSGVDGRTQLVTVGYDGHLRLWDPVTASQTSSYPLRQGVSDLINAVTVDDSATLLAVSRDDSSIELLECGSDGSLAEAAVLRVPPGETAMTTALSFHPGGSALAAAACGDGTVHLFDISAGQPPSGSVLSGHRRKVHAAIFVRLADGRTLLATGGEDGTVRLWHADPRGLPTDSEADEPPRIQAISTVSAENNDLLVAGDDRGFVHLYEAQSGTPVGNSFVGHQGAVHAVTAARLPDGRRVIVSGGAERSVRIWDVATGRLVVGPLRGHQATIHALVVLSRSPSESLVASAGADGTIRLWDPLSGLSVGAPLSGHRLPIRCLAVAPSREGTDTLISGSDDGTLRLWRLDGSGGVEFLRIDLSGPVAAAAVLNSRSANPIIAAGGSDGVVQLWDAVTGRRGESLGLGTLAEITALAVFPEWIGLLAVGYRDGVVRIWHPESGRLLRTILLPFNQQPKELVAARSHLAVCTERGFLGCELDPRLRQELIHQISA
jgi:WD40 repeat protein